MITKSTVSSCCGGTYQIYLLDKPIRKFQAYVFTNSGWSLPNSFFNSGVLFASKNGLSINGSFGGTRFHVRGKNSETIIELDHLIEQAILISA